MSAGRPGGWPVHQLQGQQTGSQHASPTNSNSSNYGDFTNPAMYPNMQGHNPAAAAAAAAAARYNASVLSSPGGNAYVQQQLSPAIQQQQQQQQQQHYAAAAVASANVNPYYAGQQMAGQAHRPGQPSPTQPIRPGSRGDVPQGTPPMFGPQVNAYGSFNPVAGHVADPNSQYGGAWISSVPSNFTPPDGSALAKSSQYQSRDGAVQPHHGVFPMHNPMAVMNGAMPAAASMQHHQYGAMPGSVRPGQALKGDRSEDVDDDAEDNEDGDGDGAARKRNQRGGASEFVKKLFRMLDDTSYAHIVSWGPHGDSFIVRDMNDFTKHVLPRHFRHSNFASFVRQLNKYDFHKVKKPEVEGQPQPIGVDQQWEFKHPAFMQGREDMLENVRRKVPAGKKVGRKDDDSPRDGSPNMPGMADAAERGAQEYSQLKDQVATLTASQDQMTSHINNLTKQYQAVIGEMLTFQKNMVQQDQLMQNLIQYLMNLEADRKIEGPAPASGAPPIADQSRPQLESSSGAFVSSRDAERLVSSFSDVAKESFSQMSMIAQRAAMNGTGTPGSASNTTPTTNITSLPRHSEEEALSPHSTQPTPANLTGQSPMTDKGKERAPSEDAYPHSIFLHPPHFEADQSSNDILSAAAHAVDNPSLAGFEGAGLRVFTVGTLQPRSDTADADPSALHAALAKDPPNAKGANSGDRPFGISVPNLEQLPAKMPRVDGRATSGNPTPGEGDSGTPSEGGQNLLRVRRSTYVPGWAVPPKVLVVDDDDVCRKLGSKFLQVFGCAIDVAVDGVTAVNKMNLEKYDLVLMDIVMPNLDGVSATSLIREFDARTPIISMTSNSGPQELLSYMSSGMTDVLPKPFTKEGLLNMLEKHLIHLKTVQKMDEIPKALGLPPLSEDLMQSVLSATAASAQSMGASSASAMGTAGANPMAAMMGNGPEMVRASQDAGHRDAFHGLEDDESLVNPLAGMGFSDEEYISMLQNLIAAGAVSDSARGENADTVANVMGVARGEGATAANGTRSKESTPQATRGSMLPPQGTVRKRAADGNAVDPNDSKKSRFTELHV